jgi:hypothetical protein
MPIPLIQDTRSRSYKDMPIPIINGTLIPLIQEMPIPIKQATPIPLKQDTPTPLIKVPDPTQTRNPECKWNTYTRERQGYTRGCTPGVPY